MELSNRLPWPRGDTGSNLDALLHTWLHFARGARFPSPYDFWERDGIRGNPYIKWNNQ